MNRKKNALCAGLLAGLMFTAAACTAAATGTPTPSPAASAPPASVASPAPAASSTPLTPPAAKAAQASASLFEEDESGWNTRMQYTQADYDFLRSLQFEGYEDMTVADYGKKFMDWNDEELYHRAEDALMRLKYSLKETDPLYDFLNGTVYRTWQECEHKHYNACKEEKLPSADGCAKYEQYGDVFGDKLLISGGYCEFWYCYRADEAKLTVRERDDFIKAMEDGMNVFLKAQDETALKDNQAMTKALKAEFTRLAAQHGSGNLTVVSAGLSYYWERMY